MTAKNILFELILVSLCIGGNTVSWQYYVSGRRGIALWVFIATVMLILVLANYWQIDLSYA